MHPDPARDIAADLLRIGAVTLSPGSPFTWASGMRTPIYCDNRLTLGHPEVRSRIADGLAHLIRLSGVEFDVVAGTATAGIPHASWVAERLKAPMAYVRNQPKGHGQGRQVEGLPVEGKKVVLVEDLISTGGSSLRAVEGLHREGASVVLVVAIFSYGLPAAQAAFHAAELPHLTLTRFDVLRQVASEQGAISDDEARSLDAWRVDPEAWSQALS